MKYIAGEEAAVSVYVKRNKKTAICRFCEKEITNGQFCVVAVYYKRQNSGQIWRGQLKWHCRCWIRQGIRAEEERERIEPAIETRGRKVSIMLTEEQKLERKRLMMRRAAVVCRIKAEVIKEESNFEKIVRLGGKLEKYREEAEALGGVPKSWEL